MPAIVGITRTGECVLDTQADNVDSDILYLEDKRFVNFGEDSVIGCNLLMNAQELFDFCSAYSDSKLRMLARNPPTRESKVS